MATPRRFKRGAVTSFIAKHETRWELVMGLFSIAFLVSAFRAINGKEGMADTLRAYSSLGVSLAFVQMYPCNEAALEELAEGVQPARASR